jgi:hypothetical protein
MPKKPKIAPRLPPLDPALARFAEEGAPARPAKGGKAAKQQADKAAKRRLMVYLPEAVAKALAHRCVDLERDVSGAVTEAVEAWLGAR